MGFFPCVAEPDIWMRAMNVDGTVMSDEDLKKEQPAFTYEGVSRPIFDGYYEYIASYVDDLTIGSRDPDSILQYLQVRAKFKLRVLVKLITYWDAIIGGTVTEYYAQHRNNTWKRWRLNMNDFWKEAKEESSTY
eukprot:scaffold33004_cov81-Skeletonema_marinoi.AAC.2